METIRNQAGESIRTSRNLRGIITHVRAGKRNYPYNLIKLIAVDPIANDGGKLCILFDNGDSYETNFASYSVLLDWIANRRTWYGAPLQINGVNSGKLNRAAVKLFS